MPLRYAAYLGMVLVGLVASCDGCEPSPPDPRTAPTSDSPEGTQPGEPWYEALNEPLHSAVIATYGDDSAERAAGLRTVAELRDARALPRLTELLRDGETEIQCQAANAIGLLGVDGRAAATDLQERLHEGIATVRQCALLALASIGGDTALSALLAHLDIAGPDDIEEAVDALGRLGRIEALPTIVQYLESPDHSVVTTAARAVERIGPGGADLVRPLLASEEPEARCAAAGILARWESTADESEVARLARSDRDRGVQICALGALGRFGDVEAVEELAEIIADSGSEHRVDAAQGLGVAATGPAIRALIRSLTAFHDDRDQPNPAQAALLAIGPTAQPLLEEALPAGPPLRRALVAQTLGLLGERSAATSLEQAALDADPMVRDAATTALQILQTGE